MECSAKTEAVPGTPLPLFHEMKRGLLLTMAKIGVSLALLAYLVLHHRPRRPAASRPGGRPPPLRRRRRPLRGHDRRSHLALAAAAPGPGLPRQHAPPLRLLPGGHLLQQLPPQQHRRGRDPRARRLAPHRLHHHLPGRRRDRPHPRPGRALAPRRHRLRPRRPRRAPPRGGPRRSSWGWASSSRRIAYVFLRPGTARPLDGRGAGSSGSSGSASRSRACSRPSTSTASR